MFLFQLIQALDERKVPYLLVGGYALGLQGIVRATVDIDLVVSLKENHLVLAEEALRGLGLESRLPVRASEIAHFHEEYRKERNLIAWTFIDYKNPTRQVDLLMTPPLRSLRGDTVSVNGMKIKVATKKTLLQMKLASNRPGDQVDILRLQKAIQGEKRQK